MTEQNDIEQETMALTIVYALKQRGMEWAQEIYDNAEVSVTLSVLYQNDLIIELSESGVEAIDYGYKLAHESLGLTADEFEQMLIESISEGEAEQE